MSKQSNLHSGFPVPHRDRQTILACRQSEAQVNALASVGRIVILMLKINAERMINREKIFFVAGIDVLQMRWNRNIQAEYRQQATPPAMQSKQIFVPEFQNGIRFEKENNTEYQSTESYDLKGCLDGRR